MAIDLAKTPEDRQVMEIVFAKFGMSRPFMAPPDLPPERLATLRRAFDATLEGSGVPRRGRRSSAWRSIR